jgi:outer membrane protein OmpA-like peptidoglycan-associated protein
MRKRPRCHAWLLAPVFLLTTACGEVLDNVPPRPAGIEDPAVAAAPFPHLAAVPARPRLTYTLEQRREIAEGLVADRANARHAGDSLREALDRPVEPDTVSPLPPVEAPPDEPGYRPGDLSLAYLEEALARDSDDGSLGDFLERLQQPPPAVAEIGPPAADPPVPSSPVPPSPVSAPPVPPTPMPLPLDPWPPVPSDDAGPGVGGEAGLPDRPAADAAAAGEATPHAAPPPPLPERAAAGTPGDPASPEPPPPALAADAPAAPALPLAIVFDADQATLREVDEAVLRRLVTALAGGDAVLVVSGGAARPALAMERARRVAAALVEAGLRPAQIALEMGGESDVVVVYEAEA